MTSTTYPPVPASVPAARRFAASLLGQLDAGLLDSTLLMVSELVTNAVRHARSEFVLNVTMDEHIVRIEVTDTGGGEPRAGRPGPYSPHGRGLMIVDALATEWGVQHDGMAKTVWFALDLSLG